MNPRGSMDHYRREPWYTHYVLDQLVKHEISQSYAAECLGLPHFPEGEREELLAALAVANKVAHVLIREDIRPRIIRSKPVIFRKEYWWSKLFRKEVS